MIRAAKPMGVVVVVAMLALGALGASPAQGQFEAESAPTTLTVSSNTLQKFAPTAGSSAFECTTMGLTGAALAGTPATTFEAAPVFSNCENFLGMPLSVAMNGCAYLFHSAAGSTTATTDIKCPAGKTIVVNVGSGPFCQYTIGETGNLGLGTIRIDNAGSGTTRELTFTLELNGMTSTRTVSGFGCPSGSNKSTYRGTFTMTGENGSGQHVGLFAD